MSTIKSICVYCASGPGNDPAFMDAARKFGRILAENGIRLVYGGGSVGVMGALAESVLDHGGAGTGVIPDFLVNREHMLLSVQERLITRDMHERKWGMFERADAFVALRRALFLRLEKGDSLDAIAVGIANEGRVIPFAVLRPQARRTLAAAAGGKRCGMERVDQFARAHAQRRMRAAIGVDRCQARAQIEPEFGIAFAEADGAR